MNPTRQQLLNRLIPIAIFLCFTSMLISISSFNNTAFVYAQNDAPTPTPPNINHFQGSCDLSGDNTGGSDFNNAVEIFISQPETSSCIDDETAQYYQFEGKAGKIYQIRTDGVPEFLDTRLSLFIQSNQTTPIKQGDDISGTDLDAEIVFQASETTTYFIKVESTTNTDGGTFTISLNLVQPDTPPTNTPLPTNTPATPLEFDQYEDNFDFNTAFVIAADQGTIYELNFVPATGTGPDNDFFRLWIKEGWTYTCQTSNLSAHNDTNMIIYDQNQVGLGGNDDRMPGDLSSEVTYQATYSGWLYILVGPNVEVNYNVSDQYTYELSCESIFATPTPTPWPTLSASQLTASAPTPTIDSEAVVVTVEPDSGEIPPVDQSDLQITIEKLEDSVVEATPAVPAVGVFTVAVRNEDATGLLYGVENMPVAIYDNLNSTLLAFGYTDDQGRLMVDVSLDSSVVDIVIPYLGLRKSVTYPESRLVEITLPSVFVTSESN